MESNGFLRKNVRSLRKDAISSFNSNIIERISLCSFLRKDARRACRWR
jgi:hypothetical protein